MATANQQASGSGLFSKLVVVLLLAVAVGLYLRIVMVDKPLQHADVTAAPQASVRVVEGGTGAVPAAPAVQPRTPELRDLPADQMSLVIQVFAPNGD